MPSSLPGIGGYDFQPGAPSRGDSNVPFLSDHDVNLSWETWDSCETWSFKTHHLYKRRCLLFVNIFLQRSVEVSQLIVFLPTPGVRPVGHQFDRQIAGGEIIHSWSFTRTKWPSLQLGSLGSLLGSLGSLGLWVPLVPWVLWVPLGFLVPCVPLVPLVPWVLWVPLRFLVPCVPLDPLVLGSLGSLGSLKFFGSLRSLGSLGSWFPGFP